MKSAHIRFPHPLSVPPATAPASTSPASTSPPSTDISLVAPPAAALDFTFLSPPSTSSQLLSAPSHLLSAPHLPLISLSALPTSPSGTLTSAPLTSAPLISASLSPSLFSHSLTYPHPRCADMNALENSLKCSLLAHILSTRARPNR